MQILSFLHQLGQHSNLVINALFVGTVHHIINCYSQSVAVRTESLKNVCPLFSLRLFDLECVPSPPPLPIRLNLDDSLEHFLLLLDCKIAPEVPLNDKSSTLFLFLAFPVGEPLPLLLYLGSMYVIV